ncbi:hypothetical protein WA158_003069 [Blastocystis sp. Blastoise]
MKAALLFLFAAVVFSQCLEGQYGPEGECKPCEKGFYCHDGVKRACTGRNYADEEGLDQCKSCLGEKMGAFATSGYGNDKCEICMAGYSCNNGQSRPCDSYSYSHVTDGVCQTCTDGNYIITESPNNRMVNTDCQSCGAGYACPNIFTRYQCAAQTYGLGVDSSDCRGCYGTVSATNDACDRVVCAEDETYRGGKCVSKTYACSALEGYTYDHEDMLENTVAFKSCSETADDNVAGYTTMVCTAEGWVEGFNYCAAPIEGSMPIDVEYTLHSVYYKDVEGLKNEIFNAFLLVYPSLFGDLIITKIEDKGNYEQDTMSTLLAIRIYAFVNKHAEIIRSFQYANHKTMVVDALTMYAPKFFFVNSVIDVEYKGVLTNYRKQCEAEVENWVDTYQWEQQILLEGSGHNLCDGRDTGVVLRNCQTKAFQAFWGPTEDNACWPNEYEANTAEIGILKGTITLNKVYYNFVGYNVTKFIIPAMIRAQPVQVFGIEISPLWGTLETIAEGTTLPPHNKLPKTHFNFMYAIPRTQMDALYATMTTGNFANRFMSNLNEIDENRFFFEVTASVHDVVRN